MCVCACVGERESVCVCVGAYIPLVSIWSLNEIEHEME